MRSRTCPNAPTCQWPSPKPEEALKPPPHHLGQGRRRSAVLFQPRQMCIRQGKGPSSGIGQRPLCSGPKCSGWDASPLLLVICEEREVSRVQRERDGDRAERGRERDGDRAERG